MREHDAEAAELEVEHEVGELQRPAEIGELEQQQRRVAAEAETAKLVVLEPGGELQVELTALEHLHRYGGIARCAAHFRDAELHLPRGSRVVLAHVRRRGYAFDAVVVRRA
jgi:hypothetical protein